MMQKTVRILFCVIPLFSFVKYWAALRYGINNAYSSADDLLWGVLVTIILTVAMYFIFRYIKKLNSLARHGLLW